MILMNHEETKSEDSAAQLKDNRPPNQPTYRIKLSFFIEMEDNVEKDLKAPEHCSTLLRFPIKNPFVSFLPNKIHRDIQRNSSHLSLQVIPLRV